MYFTSTLSPLFCHCGTWIFRYSLPPSLLYLIGIFPLFYHTEIPATVVSLEIYLVFHHHHLNCHFTTVRYSIGSRVGNLMNFVCERCDTNVCHHQLYWWCLCYLLPKLHWGYFLHGWGFKSVTASGLGLVVNVKVISLLPRVLVSSFCMTVYSCCTLVNTLSSVLIKYTLAENNQYE